MFDRFECNFCAVVADLYSSLWSNALSSPLSSFCLFNFCEMLFALSVKAVLVKNQVDDRSKLFKLLFFWCLELFLTARNMC